MTASAQLTVGDLMALSVSNEIGPCQWKDGIPLKSMRQWQTLLQIGFAW